MVGRTQIGQIRSDFLAAIERIESGKPKHPDLVELQQQGKLVLNPSTAAKESGRSRTYVGHAGCALPEIRARILAAGPGSARIGALKDAIRALKRRIAELESEVQAKDSAIAALKISLSRTIPKTITRKGTITPFRRKR